jgi:hypothetical protein
MRTAPHPPPPFALRLPITDRKPGISVERGQCDLISIVYTEHSRHHYLLLELQTDTSAQMKNDNLMPCLYPQSYLLDLLVVCEGLLL